MIVLPRHSHPPHRKSPQDETWAADAETRRNQAAWASRPHLRIQGSKPLVLDVNRQTLRSEADDVDEDADRLRRRTCNYAMAGTAEDVLHAECAALAARVIPAGCAPRIGAPLVDIVGARWQLAGTTTD